MRKKNSFFDYELFSPEIVGATTSDFIVIMFSFFPKTYRTFHLANPFFSAPASAQIIVCHAVNTSY